jgi:Gene product 88
MTHRADGHLLGPPTGKLRKRRRGHLVRGNSKVGSLIYTFSLPAVLSCPGASQTCLSSCYARRNRYRFGSVQARLLANWAASRDPFFAEKLIAEVRARQAQVVRLHPSGDLYSLSYIRSWARIIGHCHGTTFYTYTRSWCLSGLRDAIELHLAPLANLRLWYSADRDTGMPGLLPAGVRVAWLQLDENDLVPEGVDLVFRVHRLRRRPARRVGLTLVCPTENGFTGPHRTDCGTCGLCWKED